MPDNLRFSNPDAIAKPPGYSHVVEVIGPGRLVYFAGQLGMDKSGKMGANAREQMELAFANLKGGSGLSWRRFRACGQSEQLHRRYR
jgi:enamine deaminase RidA (YjgF/YER057c/UK114 family)